MKKVMRYISKIMLLMLTGIFIIISAVEAQEKTEFFPSIEGWKLSENIDTYSPETLYDAINGAGLKGASIDLASQIPELRMPFVGTLLREALAEL